MPVGALEFRHGADGDRRIIGERSGNGVAVRVVGNVLHQRRADAVGRGAVHLAFDDHGIDHRAAVIHDGIVQDPGLVGVGVDLDHGDVQLQGVGEGEVTYLLLHVRHLERRHVYVPGVQGQIAQVIRQAGAVRIDEVGQHPVVERLISAAHTDLRAHVADSEVQVLFLGFQGETGESRHFRLELERGAVGRGQAGDHELAGVGARLAGMAVVQ